MGASKLQYKLCSHLNQAPVDYVIRGRNFGFRLSFNPKAVSFPWLALQATAKIFLSAVHEG